MSDVPEAPGGEAADEASGEMAGADELAHGGAAPHAGQPGQGHAEPPEWWRREPDQPGTGPGGPSGTPPSGTPPTGTPPFGTPPTGATTPGTPSAGSPPWSTPPWGTPPWGTPPWGGAPQWYGWGPMWPGGPQPPAGPTPAASPPARPLPWVIIGGILAGLAMVAIGLGIGYSVWGGTVTAVSRTGQSAPAPRITPSLGRGGFLGVEVEATAFAPGSTSSASTSTTPGAYVVSVVPSSPASKAGIVKGDTITGFGARTVKGALTLRIDVLRKSPGSRVKVTWVTSSGAHESATVTLAKRPTSGAVG
jgi:PDZ domain